jgi:hypothetical protein
MFFSAKYNFTKSLKRSPFGYEPVGYELLCSLTFPDYFDHTPLCNGPVDTLKHLDARITIPYLRKLVACHAHAAEGLIRVLLRQKMMFGYKVMFEYVKRDIFCCQIIHLSDYTPLPVSGKCV